MRSHAIYQWLLVIIIIIIIITTTTTTENRPTHHLDYLKLYGTNNSQLNGLHNAVKMVSDDI